MKLSQAKEYLPFVQAAADGKVIELYLPGSKEWKAFDDVDFSAEPHSYRIKPELKLRPWRPEEVPVGALVKYCNMNGLICGAKHDGINVQVFCGFGCVTAFHLEQCAKYSIDHGKTWLPCGVPE